MKNYQIALFPAMHIHMSLCDNPLLHLVTNPPRLRQITGNYYFTGLRIRGAKGVYAAA